MTTTNLIVAKRAVIGYLQDKQATQPALNDVLIHYAYNPKLAEQEYVWGGAARFVRGNAGLAGPYDEQISLELFVDVRAFAAELEAADARGGEIAEVLDGLLSADPKLGNVVPGLVYRSVTSGEIAYGYYDDDSATSSLGLELLLRCHLGSGR